MLPSEMGLTPEQMGILPVEKSSETQEKKKKIRLTREDVEARREAGENLENCDLSDLDLAGLNFEGVSFRDSDLRGVQFFRRVEDDDGSVERTFSNLKGADFTDALIVAGGEEWANFIGAQAEGVIFGNGGLRNFSGDHGKFTNSRWNNIVFGDADYTSFSEADLTGAVMIGCDFSGVDFSKANIDDVKIIDPIPGSGLIINESQVQTIVEAISFTDGRQVAWAENKARREPIELLQNTFGIEIIQL